jgi:hypothetical protein
MGRRDGHEAASGHDDDFYERLLIHQGVESRDVKVGWSSLGRAWPETRSCPITLKLEEEGTYLVAMAATAASFRSTAARLKYVMLDSSSVYCN